MAIKTDVLVSDYMNMVRVTTNFDEDMLYLDAGQLGHHHLEMSRVTLNLQGIRVLYAYLSRFLEGHDAQRTS